jgi:hypothetical protein
MATTRRNSNNNGPKKKNRKGLQVLKWTAAAAGGAIIGAIAVDTYREYKAEKKAELQTNPANAAVQALFGAGAQTNPFQGPPGINVSMFAGGQMPEPPKPPEPPKMPELEDMRPDPAWLGDDD